MAHPNIRKRVLIIVSNTEAAEILGILLRGHEYDVVVEHAGLSGLTVAKSYYPDAVILDLETSATDNYEIAARLRSMSALRDVYLISLSNSSSAPSLDDVSRIDSHLKKPIGYKMIPAILSHHFLNQESGRANSLTLA